MEIYTLDCPIKNIPKYIGFTSKSLNEKKKHNRKGKNIIKCDLNNNTIECYNSIREASNLNNITRTAIINNLKNRTKTSGNYIWKYLENIN